ncbi:MAG: hypothetical protein MR419_03815 [Clostridiales bacterium]|nr:hypothetical protein [Clostridiales bacterium]MDY4172170.1 hypothetical protein [Evtepia sp.]
MEIILSKEENWNPLCWASNFGDGSPTRAGGAGTLGLRGIFSPAEPAKK